MSVSNPWLNPFQRSYGQIKEKLIENLKVQVPEITDFSEGNIFILIISIFAAIAEVLHYYIDNMARETFFTSARRYTSLVKHAKLVDYHQHAGIPSMVDVLISRKDNTPIDTDINIPIGTVFTDNSGNQWLSTKAVTWLKGTYGVNIPLEQKQLVSEITLGLVPGKNTYIELTNIDSGLYYVEGSMTLTVSGIIWELVSTFAYSTPYSRHFKVELNENRVPCIVFGDGVNGKIPITGAVLVCSYYVTKGENGNIDEGNITSLPSVITDSVSNAVCSNTNSSVGGSNYETFDQMKFRVPLSIKTLGVAITKEDYENIAMMIPGVDKAYVNYICGKYLEIYISPTGGGIAPQALIDKVLLNILSKKVITTTIKVLPVSIIDIYITANITGRKSFQTSDISNQVKKALIDNYGYENAEIGRPVRLSDVYAIIDNLSMVDYLSIENIFIKPYPSKIGSTLSELNISYFNISLVSNKIQYIIKYTGDNNFDIYTTKDIQPIKSITLGTSTLIDDTKNDNHFSLTISEPKSGSYVINNSWVMWLYKNNMDQEPDSISLPIFRSDNIFLNIQETV